MEQEKLSQRIVNRRRPFRPKSDISQRYLRLRQDANLSESLSDSDDLGDFRDWNWWCPCCDPTHDPYVSYKLTEILSRVMSPMNPVSGFDKITANSPVISGEAETQIFENRRQDDAPLEKRLAKYVERFLDRAVELDAVRPQIIESVGDLRNLEVIKLEAEMLRCPGLAKLICFFSPFWAREPLTWDRDSGVPLLDHVFVLYEVPQFLTAEWMRQAELEKFELKWLCWFLLFAQGGSLKRAAADFNWNIPNKFQHTLQALPASWSPLRACLFAEVQRLGGNETDFGRICSYPSFVIDLTADSRHDSDSVFWSEPAAVDANFWRETMCWLIANRAAITDRNSHRILSWALHEYTEAQRRSSQEAFSLKGRSARKVIEKSLEYFGQLTDREETYQWQNHGWNWTLDNFTSDKWEFVELTSSEELFWEGRTMSHCVYTYDYQCSAGDAAIVSVLRSNAACLTIEINPTTQRVVQIRGAFNRPPNSEEQKAVNLWLSEVVRSQASAQEVKQD